MPITCLTSDCIENSAAYPLKGEERNDHNENNKDDNHEDKGEDDDEERKEEGGRGSASGLEEPKGCGLTKREASRQRRPHRTRYPLD